MTISGYQFITTLFSDAMGGESRVVTIPLRIATLFMYLLTFVLVIKYRYLTTFSIKLFLLYWALLYIRLIFDYTSHSELTLLNPRFSQVLLYMIGLCTIPMIVLMKSYRFLNFDKLLFYCYVFCSSTILVMFFGGTGFQEATTQRLDANLALGSIEAGHLGLTTLILGVFILFKGKGLLYKNLFVRISILFITIISFFVLVRAGSRGPVFAAALVFGFYILSKTRKAKTGIVLLLLSTVLIYFTLDLIIEFVEVISPILKQRLFDREDQLWDRAPLIAQAMSAFYDNPFFGRDFFLYSSGMLYYPHNLFVESLMQLGIFGCGILVITIYYTFKSCRKLIRFNSSQMWLALLFIQSFAGLMLSSTLATEPKFCILLLLVNLSSKYVIYDNKL